MQKYDVVIIGAGPAGGQCARELSQKGFKVLLVERAKSFLENNYSSGGAPQEIMSQFQLPSSIVGAYWNTFHIHSTRAEAKWISSSPFGPIIDFDKLRSFLAEELVKYGGNFRLGCQYEDHQIFSHAIEVHLKDVRSSAKDIVETSLLVDATGTERKVLAQKNYDKQKAIVATGIEYHIQVKEEVYQKYSQTMNFFLGHHWMAQGYGWIFPMAPSLLKVGVIRYFQNQQIVTHDPSYQIYLQRLLELCGPHQICNKHGKTLFYTPRQKDLRYNDRIIAIGDAISSVNPLGWEGIRHAMVSGRLAAQTIDGYLNKRMTSLKHYHQAMKNYFGFRWIFSEMMMKYLFTTKRDDWIDHSVRSFSLMNNEEIMRVIFDYQFRHTLKSFFWYYTSYATI